MAAWLDILAGGETKRHPLRPGLTQIGGAGADVALPPTSAPEGEVHVWDDPPKVVRVRGPELRTHDGDRSVTELPLVDGARFRWGTVELVYGCDPPVLEEVPLEEVEPPRSGALADSELRAWRRVQAGLLVELGKADRAAVQRWQSAVKESRFDADAASRELLDETSFDASDPLFVDRCGALLRDLLMAPLLRGTRGATRRARGAAKSGVAFLVAQVVAILVYSLLVGAFLILVRAKWGVSFDEWIDLVLGG